MAKRAPRTRQAEIVGLFAGRLRELRRSRGMTQADLAERAKVTPAYMWRLESGTVAPGIDLLDRLAKALGAEPGDLLPASAPVETDQVLRDQAKKLFDALLKVAGRDTFALLNPYLAHLLEADRKR